MPGAIGVAIALVEEHPPAARDEDGAGESLAGEVAHGGIEARGERARGADPVEIDLLGAGEVGAGGRAEQEQRGERATGEGQR